MAGITKYITWSGGPTGDYTTDGTADQTEINAALSWANANPGNTVYLKGPHTYLITGQILVGNSTVWTGDSTAIIKVADYACGGSATFGTSGAWCAFPDGTPVIGSINTYPTGIEISQFSIDGNCETQYTKLGAAHGSPSSSGSGVERVIQFHGDTGKNAADIHIHHMHIYDSFGEAFQSYYSQNVRIHDCQLENHQHDAIFLICVTGTGNKVYNNTIQGITDGCIRLDNCQNFDIYGNHTSYYTGTHNNGAYKYGTNGLQIANESNKPIKTSNINIYNNTIANAGLAGIWFNDTLKSAGTTAQNVHVYNNTFTNDGMQGNSGVAYVCGISIDAWGNGLLIENNTFDSCWVNAINILTTITTSSCSIEIKNNNFLNTKLVPPSGTALSSTYRGYAIYNAVPSRMTPVLTGNYFSGNVTGKVYPTSMAHTDSTTSNGVLPGSSTTDDDVPIVPGDETPTTPTTTTPVKYIPRIRALQSEWAFSDYYINNIDGTLHTSYVNGWPINITDYTPSTNRVLSQNFCPSVQGWNIGDFGFEGSEITLTCWESSLSAAWDSVSAWHARAPAVLELGGAFQGWYLEGIPSVHSSTLKVSDGDVPEEGYTYTVKFNTLSPFIKNNAKRIRSRLIYNSMQWSADDGTSGNQLKNPSFESWTSSTNMTWANQTTDTDNAWSFILFAEDLGLWIAGANTGTSGTIMTSADGITFNAVTTLPNANFWRAGVWIPPNDTLPTGRVVIVGESGTGNRVITSDDGITFTAQTSAADNSWDGICYIEPNDTLTNGRLVAVAYAGTNRVMYSDDFGVTWSAVASANESCAWMGIDYSESLIRLASVGYNGTAGHQVMTSDDYGATWTLQATPATAQQWTAIVRAEELNLFVACAQDTTLATQVMTSPDGITWTSQTTPTTAANQWRDICWSRRVRLLVCVAKTGAGNQVMSSEDGITWIARTSPATSQSWMGIEYGIDRFVAVASSGTHNRAMSCSDYGTAYDIAPDKWTLVTKGQSLSYDNVVLGSRSYLITGDGVTADIGCITQPASCENGTDYVLSASCHTVGLTTGQLVIEIYSGGATVKELVWSADTDEVQKNITVKYTIAPLDAVIKIHGIGTVNSGALLYVDNVIFEKMSDFELSTTGKDLITYGNEDVIPDVEARGVSSSSGTSTIGNIVGAQVTFDSGEGSFSSAATSYKIDNTSLEFTYTLPALTNGAKYRIDQVSCKLSVASAGATAYCAINIHSPSLWGGTETRVAQFTASSTTAAVKTQALALTAGANEAVTFKYFLKTSSKTKRAMASDFGGKYSPITGSVLAVSPDSSGLSIYNVDDPLNVLDVCNWLPPNCRIRINADYTGFLEYSDNFEDNSYAAVCSDISTGSLAPVYSATNRTLTLPSNGGFVTWLYDSKYPITGTPFMECYVISGCPELWISQCTTDGSRTPLHWYTIDGNTTSQLANASIYRELDNSTYLSLAGETLYFVCIKAPVGGTDPVVLGSMFHHADLVTIDAPRPKIFATGQPNTFSAILSGNPVNCILRYNDQNLVI